MKYLRGPFQGNERAVVLGLTPELRQVLISPLLIFSAFLMS
jgi:hypothetical protein